MASAMNRLRQASLLSVVAAVLLSVTCAHPSLAADRRGSRPAQAGFSLRPPFNGTYRLTALFDHRYPTMPWTERSLPTQERVFPTDRPTITRVTPEWTGQCPSEREFLQPRMEWWK